MLSNQRAGIHELPCNAPTRAPAIAPTVSVSPPKPTARMMHSSGVFPYRRKAQRAAATACEARITETPVTTKEAMRLAELPVDGRRGPALHGGPENVAADRTREAADTTVFVGNRPGFAWGNDVTGPQVGSRILDRGTAGTPDSVTELEQRGVEP